MLPLLPDATPMQSMRGGGGGAEGVPAARLNQTKQLSTKSVRKEDCADGGPSSHEQKTCKTKHEHAHADTQITTPSDHHQVSRVTTCAAPHTTPLHTHTGVGTECPACDAAIPSRTRRLCLTASTTGARQPISCCQQQVLAWTAAPHLKAAAAPSWHTSPTCRAGALVTTRAPALTCRSRPAPWSSTCAPRCWPAQCPYV